MSYRNTRSALVPAVLTLAVGACMLPAGISAQEGSSPEMFALSPGNPFLMNDATGLDGLTGVYRGVPYVIRQGYAIAGGDMVLGPVTAQGGVKTMPQRRGFGQTNGIGRWPDGIIYYAYDSGLSQLQRDKISEAVAHWMKNTRLTLREVDENTVADDVEFVRFISSPGCYSYVGRTGDEPGSGKRGQPVGIAESCSVGSIIHEIGHVIGMYHEHTRPDRDNFIRVNWDEISSSKFNFEKIEANSQAYSDYDYDSIMHYGEYFFSRRGERTIEVLQDGHAIGQREKLSPLDIAAANRMYETDLSVSQRTASNGNQLEVTVTVTNNGELGANGLVLRLRMGDSVQFQEMSQESGWECLAYGTELRCTRDTLREQFTSEFSVFVAANSATEADVSVRLESRTQDTDLSNNAFNDDGSPIGPTSTGASGNNDGSNGGSNNSGSNNGGSNNQGGTDGGTGGPGEDLPPASGAANPVVVGTPGSVTGASGSSTGSSGTGQSLPMTASNGGSGTDNADVPQSGQATGSTTTGNSQSTSQPKKKGGALSPAWLLLALMVSGRRAVGRLSVGQHAAITGGRRRRRKTGSGQR